MLPCRRPCVYVFDLRCRYNVWHTSCEWLYSSPVVRWVDRRYSPGARITPPLSLVYPFSVPFAISKERHIIAAERRPSLRRRQRSYLVRARSPEMDTPMRGKVCNGSARFYSPGSFSLYGGVLTHDSQWKKKKKKSERKKSFDSFPSTRPLWLRPLTPAPNSFKETRLATKGRIRWNSSATTDRP